MPQPTPEKQPVSVFNQPQRRRRSEPSLSRERIVAASVALLDREGAGSLTMRKVAAELGVHATSLYWYVKRREDLVDLAVDEVLSEAVNALPGAEVPWDAAVFQGAKQFYAALTDHPWAAEFAGVRPLIGPNALALSKRILSALHDGGGTGEDQAIAATAISHQVLGAAVTAASISALGLGDSADPADELAAAVGTPEKLDIWIPHIDSVLELLIDGIRARFGNEGLAREAR